ncbi:hypothetical protein TSUD_375810 [Trifolium subterraneum]|uniref:TF-B3 domain-containing protein n=1 Tax=Trifolium subterraneum TaxID=3900 RepID=A0A2Z6M2W5_TRISU|nr:hypothetical protein TSUD_375810 [Trifolium subterraneum]
MKKFGEIDPTFVEEFKEQLPEKWKIIDYRYQAHTVTYNKDETLPLFTDGWHEMRDVFDLHQNEEIHFGYYGKDVFGIIAARRFESETQIPTFHSRCVTPGRAVRFQVELSKDTINNCYLSIWNDFEAYVKGANLNKITACGDNVSKTVFKVAIHDEPFESTCIGVGWWPFCRNCCFHSGDVICFKFSLVPVGNNVVHVFKLRC